MRAQINDGDVRRAVSIQSSTAARICDVIAWETLEWPVRKSDLKI